MTTLMVAFLSLGLYSCSNDDEEKSGGNSPEDNLPEASKSFVGYWRNSQENLVSSCDFVFFGDGSCSRYASESGGHMDKGYWTFNDITKILATTVGEWQWEVTLSNSETWAGISLGSAKTQTFKRDDTRYALACLENTTWECDTLAMTFGYGNMKYISIPFSCDDYTSLMELYPRSSGSSRALYITDASVSNSNIIANYTVEDRYEIWRGRYREWETETRDIDTGTITIKNYNRSSASITLSKHPDHEYKLKRD